MPHFDVFPFLFVGEPHISPSGKFSINLVNCLISFILATVSALFVWPLVNPCLIALTTDQKTEIDMLMKCYRRAEWISRENMTYLQIWRVWLDYAKCCSAWVRNISHVHWWDDVSIRLFSVLGSCPSGWIKFDQHCYLFRDTYRDHMTWTSARYMCLKQGANLLSITSKQEQDFISHHFIDDRHGHVWLGMSWNWM